MSVLLATLCLNEIEHLPKLHEQHKDWPGLTKWVFVESADRLYAQANPEMVTPKGLSVDGTTEFLEELCRRDDRVVHIKFGFSEATDPAQGKCQSRQQYLNTSEEVKPDFIYVVDADEYYPESVQEEIMKILESSRRSTGFCFRQRHIWRPQSIIKEPLFGLEVVGGFWDIPHCRGWKWFPNMKYERNHNTPQVGSRGLDHRMTRFDETPGTPECVHLGFASSLRARKAKHRYYKERGEGIRDHRDWYVKSRQCFEYWTPGEMILPHGAKVIPYKGLIPECFREGSKPSVWGGLHA